PGDVQRVVFDYRIQDAAHGGVDGRDRFFHPHVREPRRLGRTSDPGRVPDYQLAVRLRAVDQVFQLQHFLHAVDVVHDDSGLPDGRIEDPAAEGNRLIRGVTDVGAADDGGTRAVGLAFGRGGHQHGRLRLVFVGLQGGVQER